MELLRRSSALRHLIILPLCTLCLTAFVGSGPSLASGSTSWREAGSHRISGRDAREPNAKDVADAKVVYPGGPELVTPSPSTKASRNLEQQTTAQQPQQTEVRELKQGQVVERELAAGDAHTYRIELTAGQYLRVVVEQKGIDVVVRLYGLDGQQMVEVDNDPAVGEESASVVAGASGVYRLEVRSEKNDVAGGTYEIRIEELREATSKDRVHVAAQKAFEEANQLRDQRTAESKQKAIKKYEEALPLWRDAGDKKGETDTLNEIGFVYASLSEPLKALEYYGQALRLSRAAGYRKGEASALSNTGMAYWRLGESDKAMEYHSHALPMWRAMGDRQSEAVTLNNVGLAHTTLGQFKEALEYFNQALLLRRAAGDRRGETVTLNNIATVYEQSGDLQRALEYYYNQVLPLRRAVGERRGEAITLGNIAAVYSQLADLQKALEYYDKAMPLARAVGDRQQEAIILQGLGTVSERLGDLQKALEYLGQALTLSRAVGDRRQESYILGAIGVVHGRLGETNKALGYYDQALSLSRSVGYRYGEIHTLNHIGDSYLILGEQQKALEYYHQSLQLSRDIGNRLDEAASLYGIARAQRKLGDSLQARTHVQAALDIIESTRNMVTSQQLRSSFLESNQNYYEFYIDLLMQMHKDQPSAGHEAAALQASEHSRARNLLEILIEARADIRQGVEAALLEHERSLQQRLSIKSERLTRLLGSKHTEEQETSARKEVEALLGEYEEVEADIRAKSPRYAALTHPQPLSLKEIQQQVLDGDTLLLEYALGEERSYLWAITSTSLAAFELPPKAEIEALARRAYDLLTSRRQQMKFEKEEQRRRRIMAADAEYFKVAVSLSRMILEPAASLLKKSRLLIVADGALQYLPFASLPLPKSLGRERQSPAYAPLIERYEIVNLPSASTLAVLRREIAGRRPAPKAVAVLADPVFDKDDERLRAAGSKEKATQSSGVTQDAREKLDSESELSRAIGDMSASGAEVMIPRLPFTRKEADAIARIVPPTQSKQALDFEASKSTAGSPELSQYRIVHFATHGFVNTAHPYLSGIVLSLFDERGSARDGFLMAHEVYNLNLPAELIVLSGCRTGLGKEVRGEGLLALTRSFMYAGAARVMVSLWDIDDESTAELMSRFYRAMLGKQRSSAASAARSAQLSMLKDKRWSFPYFWAGFVLQGEPQ